MIKKGQMLVILIGMMFMSIYAEATTVFARQYDMKCSGCHVGMPPMLNKTGMTFFRNGFRFSKDDLTTLERALSEDDNKSLIPMGLFIGVGQKRPSMTVQTPKGTMKNENTITNPTASIFMSGSINKNWSGFIGGKYAYMEEVIDSGDRSIELLRKKFYAQYTSDDTSHVTRVGLISPYAQFGNVDKGSEYAGLDNTPQFFVTPLFMANASFIYGFDYTYAMNNGVTLLAAAGRLDDGNNENDITLGVSYFNNENFRISAIFNKIMATDSEAEIQKYTPAQRIIGERTTVIVPVEYIADFGYINSAVVYADTNKDPSENYYGWETSITVPVFEVGKVSASYTTDNNGDYSYSFGYSQLIYDSIMLQANYAKFLTDNAEFDAVGLGINYVF